MYSHTLQAATDTGQQHQQGSSFAGGGAAEGGSSASMNVIALQDAIRNAATVRRHVCVCACVCKWVCTY
jgi:hypothetical protein